MVDKNALCVRQSGQSLIPVNNLPSAAFLHAYVISTGRL